MRMNDGLQPGLRVTFTAEADACTEECDGSKNVSAVPELKLQTESSCGPEDLFTSLDEMPVLEGMNPMAH